MHKTNPVGPAQRAAHFVRVAMLVAVSAILATVAGVGQTSAAPQASDTAVSPVTRAFEVAARHWNVPVQVLMAIGHVESHWEQRDGAPSIDHGYGIMHLVDGEGGTLARSASLTGLSEDAIRKFPEANIEAGAALLSDISGKLRDGKTDATVLEDWYGAVQEYSGATDESVREGYAQEVFRVVGEGVQATLQSGEVVVLASSALKNLPARTSLPPASDDYGPAHWVPAHTNNYTVGRPYGPQNVIIIHDTEGSYSSSISWFQNPNSGVSAHYVIRSSDGDITQMVREANTAYHAGNWDYNVRAFGIEHEGFANQQGWYTEAMYQASAGLARHLADTYAVPIDRAHIIGHYQVPNQTHTDPGPYWNWTYYMGLVRRDSDRAALVDNTDSGFVAVPTPIDPAHYWNIYDGGYNGSNCYVTTSVTNPQSSVNSGTWTTYLPNSGYYDVYAFIPWVDNHNSETTNARYTVYAADGTQISHVSQKAITDVGSGSWAHVGRFLFNGGAPAQVSLSDYAGETGRNVWFDAVMWIPTTSSGLPTNTPIPSATRSPTRTPTWTPTNTPVRPPTNTPIRTPIGTATPVPTNPIETATETPFAGPTWTPGPCGMRFVDLPEDYWAYSYISYLYCNGVISGYADGTFRPGASTTRGQLTKLLALGFGWNLYNPVFPDFTDVPVDHPFYQYIETAFVRGVVSGYADGTFLPGNEVGRAQVAKMLVLAKGWDLVSPLTPDFTDVPIDHWAYGYVETVFSNGVVSGYADGTFHPGAAVIRAQISKMLTLTLQQPNGPRMKAAP